MEKIGLPKIEEKTISANSSTFTIEPLFPGYGPTVGNSLRRVLLSSIIGVAATRFRVEGNNHEFSAIQGVKEDMIELLINLKNVHFRSFSDEPVIIQLNKKGPGEITAADFSPNSQIEIINPEQHLLSLDKDADFNMEVVVEKDRGFRTASADEEKKEIGWIGIDASFSPVERVSIEVENTRVGQMTNYDKVILNVITNGAVTPNDAVKEASRVLVDHFEAIISDPTFNPELTEKLETIEASEEEEIEEDSSADTKIKIEEAGFSPRTMNALLNSNIRTIAGLKRLSPLKIEEIKGLGKKGVQEVNEVLAKYE